MPKWLPKIALGLIAAWILNGFFDSEKRQLVNINPNFCQDAWELDAALRDNLKALREATDRLDRCVESDWNTDFCEFLINSFVKTTDQEHSHSAQNQRADAECATALVQLAEEKEKFSANYF